MLAKSSQAQTLDSFVVRVYPKYLYLLTISSSFPYKNHSSPTAVWPPFLKTITFVLSKFTIRPKDLDALRRLFIWFCNPDGVEDTKTISSANRSEKISSWPGSNWIPCFPLFRTKLATSDIRREKIKGLSRHPCFTPWGQAKKSEMLAPHLTVPKNT